MVVFDQIPIEDFFRHSGTDIPDAKKLFQLEVSLTTETATETAEILYSWLAIDTPTGVLSLEQPTGDLIRGSRDHVKKIAHLQIDNEDEAIVARLMNRKFGTRTALPLD